MARTIVLGVTGGIAAYKAADIVSRLRKKGVEVYVILTKNACEFITPLTMETLSAHPAVSDMFKSPAHWDVEHISLAKRADLFLIAPATANFIGKYANGIADDMLTTTILATKAPVMLAPAMNTGMYESFAVRRNLETLRNQGVEFVGPDAGLLACGDVGAGKMSSPEEIVEAALLKLERPKLKDGSRDLQGVSVLVTAGPTREMLDPVRYLTNRSSGKMGYAIAQAAQSRGADVALVSGPVALPAPAGVERIMIESTQELYDCIHARFEGADIVIQAAAPSDFRAEAVSAQKIKRAGAEKLVLNLVANPDIAHALGQKKRPGQVLVAFAAETENLVSNAREKLLRKNADLMVANDVTRPGAGFDADTNIVTLISKARTKELPQMDKRMVADAILDEIQALRRG